MSKKQLEAKVHHLESLFQNTIKYIDAYIRFTNDAIKFDKYIHEGVEDEEKE